MKKLAVFLFILFALTMGMDAFAEESGYFPVTVPIAKIYSHVLGYRVLYKISLTEAREAYIPMSWFYSGGKAEAYSGHGTAYPYMVVYYKDGKFSHVKLYVPDDSNDERWAVFPQGFDPTEKFNSTQELVLQWK